MGNRVWESETLFWCLPPPKACPSIVKILNSEKETKQISSVVLNPWPLNQIWPVESCHPAHGAPHMELWKFGDGGVVAVFPCCQISGSVGSPLNQIMWLCPSMQGYSAARSRDMVEPMCGWVWAGGVRLAHGYIWAHGVELGWFVGLRLQSDPMHPPHAESGLQTSSATHVVHGPERGGVSLV